MIAQQIVFHNEGVAQKKGHCFLNNQLNRLYSRNPLFSLRIYLSENRNLKNRKNAVDEESYQTLYFLVVLLLLFRPQGHKPACLYSLQNLVHGERLFSL
ncbi:hypothetical protein MSP8886_04226 [Marinomonas spartinae]|uniref:Uncharacterized protein n=1 Tax=Marinomonas spartinae TaxID=1792290 RepID=A0A1A8TUQ5_9GAMM|nr:hypothetical protein MSP8886_04226 [Marinomonas spartinae]